MDVQRAIELVDRDYYVLKEDGSNLIQTSSTEAIASGLCMLDVKPGHRVLEIGTGSGYSTALLAKIVGEFGSITSVDIDPKLTERAKGKLSSYPWVKCITGDGREGFSPNAPYDRIIAWATPQRLPEQWIEQLCEGGILVTPFLVYPILRCIVTAKFTKQNGQLYGVKVSEEGYIRMDSDPEKNVVGPEVYADYVGDEEFPILAGAIWMKKESAGEWAKRFLQYKPSRSPYSENGKAIRAFLLAMRPEGFTYVSDPRCRSWLGYSSPKGFALVSEFEPSQWIVSDEEHKKVLCSWWEEWERMGKPGYEQLEPYVAGDQILVRWK